MPDHRALLQRMSARDLRAIATRLRVESPGARNADRVSAVANYWAKQSTAQQGVLQLSSLAREALQRLSASGRLPAPLFFGEYGTARPAQKRYMRGLAPWRRPQTATEELYYAGLLFPEPGSTLAKAHHLVLPDELHSLDAIPAAPPTIAHEPGDRAADGAPNVAPILHDLAQLLIALHCYHALRPEAGLLHGRWLRPPVVADLCRRLMQPDTGPPPRSHKQSPRLRLLMFLATAMGLHDGGGLTPAGWEWLRAPDARRYAAIWLGYRQATAKQRSTYLLPDAGLPAPWPALLARALADMPSSFTPDALATMLLRVQPDAPLFWSLHLTNLSALNDLAVSVVREVLAPLGVAVAVLDATGCCTHAQITTQGRLLIAGEPIPDLPQAVAPTEVYKNEEDYVVELARADDAAAQIAPFADWEALTRIGSAARHTWRIRRKTVQRAAAAGCPLSTLLNGLNAAGGRLALDDQVQLARWHTAVGSVRVGLWPLLRTENRMQMQAILDDAHTARLATELLAPTAAVLHDDLHQAADLLRKHGWHVAGGVLDAGASTVKDKAIHTARRQSTAGDLPGTAPDMPTGEQAALWLAGQLYRALSRHLALALPLPSIALDCMYARFPPAVQGALAAAWGQTEQDLLTFLDGDAPFALPIAENGGEQWRALLAEAVAGQRRLAMVYLSPARGLPTRRIVEPYALETRRGVDYLRAYCLRADRVLTFRLDRIVELTYSTE